MASPQRHLYHSLKKKSIIFSFLISNRVLHRLWLVPFLNKKKSSPVFHWFFFAKKKKLFFVYGLFFLDEKKKSSTMAPAMKVNTTSSSAALEFSPNKKKQCHRIFQNWFAVPSDDLFGLVSGFFFSRVVSSSLKKRRRRHFSPPFHRKSTGSSLFLIFFVNFFFQLSPPTQPDLVSKFLYLFFLQSIAMIYFYFLK